MLSRPENPDTEASGFADGSLIGGYRVLETIDTGPEATLYHVEPVAEGEGRLRGFSGNGVIVLGSIRRGRIDPDRFAEAARRLAGVETPSLSRPLHGGVTSDRRVWVLYGDSPGEPFDAFCDRLRLGVEQRLRWISEVLGALSSAHSQLVLHGFLAPELVRVVEEDGEPRLVVFGFGLHALAGSGQAIDGPALLAAGMPLTPLASPEELLGEPLSVASDVYRAGLLLLRVVFGPRPKGPVSEEGGGDAGAVEDEHQARVRVMVERATMDPCDRYEALDPAEQEAIAEARSTTPEELAELLRGDLGRLLAQTMAEEPADRPGSADAVASRLRAWWAEPELPVVEAAPTSRLRGSLAWIGAAVLVVLVGAWGWTRWSETARRADRATIEARVERTLVETYGLASTGPAADVGLPAELERNLEAEGPRFVVEALSRLAEIDAGSGAAARALARHEEAHARAVAAFGEESFEAAVALLRAARSAVDLHAEVADEWARRAFHAIHQARGPHPAEEIEAGLLLAGAVADTEPERAVDLADRALTRLGGSRSPARGLGLGAAAPAGLDRERASLEARLTRSRALVAAGRLEEAGEELERAASSPALERSPQLAADLWSVRAFRLERSGGSAEERVTLLEKELEALTGLEGEGAPSTLDASRRLAEALAAAGRLEGAIARMESNAELADAPEERVSAWERVGRWQVDAARPLEAVESFDRALAEELEPGRRSALEVLAASAELRGGRSEEALERLDRAIDPSDRSPLMVAARARALAALGRSGAAVALREALDELRLAEADDTLVAAPLLVALGEELTAEGEAIVAEAYLRRALTILEQAAASEYLIAEAESALGEGLVAQGRTDEGIGLLRRSAGTLAARDDGPARRARQRAQQIGG